MARSRRPSATPTPPSTLQPDPSRIGVIPDVPFARLPDPGVLFTVRAGRLNALAVDHPLADYLRFLAAIVEVQHAATAALPRPSLPSAEQRAMRLEHAMPALSSDTLAEAGFGPTLAWLLERLAGLPAPEQAMAARSRLQALGEAERLAMAAGIMESAYPAEQLAEALYVAAALQVVLARQAAQLDVTALKAVADGVCPCCGGTPVASLVVGWTQAEKARYLACSLCGTQWNHVRIRCTACGSTKGISYYTLGTDGPEAEQLTPPDIGVETCTECKSYVKHMQQHANVLIEPLADDVGSYGLDLMLRETEFRRAGINPLFVTG